MLIQPTQLHRIPLPDGRVLAMAEYGAPEGQPLLFFHGTPGSHLLAGLIAPSAAAHGFRLLAPDRPGIGYSDPHPGRTQASFAADVAQALQHLGIHSTALVGISGGGPYALAMAERFPQLLRRVVLLSPWWFPYSGRDALRGLNPVIGSYAWLMQHAACLTKPMSWLGARLGGRHPARLLKQFMRHAPADDRQLLGATFVQTQLKADITMAFRQGWRGQWQEAQLCFLPPDVTPAHIRLPITIFHGAEDNVVPLHYAEKLAQQLPQATLKTDAVGGHFLGLRLQEEVFTLLK